jgi:hypothetical protein
MSYQQNENGGNYRSRPSAQDRGLNINSIFLTVLIAISGWTLLKVVTLGEANVAQTGATIELRARMVAAEVQLQANTIAITRLQARIP